MDERRAGVPAADPSGLTPTQQAYSAYVTHALVCADCQSLDGGQCAESERLWQVYRQLRRDERAAARPTA